VQLSVSCGLLRTVKIVLGTPAGQPLARGDFAPVIALAAFANCLCFDRERHGHAFRRTAIRKHSRKQRQQIVLTPFS